MKKVMSFLLSLVLLSLCASCGQADAPATSAPATTAPAETTTVATEPYLTGPAALDGKKILFIGNSYTAWGNTVFINPLANLTQDLCSNDQGYFYQLCKANGIDASVTNWTHGDHDLTDIMESCNAGTVCAGEKHQYFLADPVFDYVCIQLYMEKEYKGDLWTHLQPTMDFFRQANPDVKFLLLVPHMAAEKNFVWYEDLGTLEGKDITVCNWGTMLHDICQGNVTVPSATLQFVRTSFVNTLDDHHENALAGYITTLMTYCAITGESAVGQPYQFCDDSAMDDRFDLEAYRTKFYPDGATNFVEIFRSEADMKGLQQLVDQYLAK